MASKYISFRKPGIFTVHCSHI